MRRLLLVGVFLVGIWYVASLHAYRTEPFQQRIFRGWPGEPYDWSADAPGIRRVSLDEATIPDDLLRTVHRWETYAQQLASDDDHHQPWYATDRNNARLIQWWSNMPKCINRHAVIEDVPLARKQDVWIVGIQFETARNSVTLFSAFQPQQGISARIAITTKVGRDAVVWFGFDGLNAAESNGFRRFYFDREANTWDYRTTFDEVHYNFRVPSLPENKTGLLAARVEVDPFYAVPQTADEFLALGIDRLDELQREIEHGIQGETAVIGAFRTKTIGGDHGGNPPREVPIPSSRRLSDSEKTDVLTAVAADIDSRRAVLRTHYRDMHRALMQACSPASGMNVTP